MQRRGNFFDKLWLNDASFSVEHHKRTAMKNELILREATAEDAPAVLHYLHQLLSQGPVDIPRLVSEISVTVEQEAQSLQRFLDEPNSLFLLAEKDGQIVGNLDLKGYQRKALRHVAVLGMAIQRDLRGQGLGKALMMHALAWAKQTELKRIELFVYTRNQPALALYTASGFVVEGCRKGFIYEAGEYLDDYIMALYL